MAGQIAGGGDPAKLEAAKARAASLVGRTIEGRYRIVELVAMGGMGAVYKGEHALMRKQVAIKVLHPDIEDFPELVARFEREAIAGAHVNHPNVASASDFGKFDGESYFLVLEYIEGFTLAGISGEPVHPLRAAKLMRQVAAGLGAAHARGIIHRDVKPANIMVCSAPSGDDELVKIIDFGLAKVPVEKLSTIGENSADGRELTTAGVVMGTVSYMAPETALGMSSVQARSDFYSMGIILYEMLTGLHPFNETSPQRIFAAHCAVPPPPLAVRNPGVTIPSDLEAIVMRLLEKDPDKRYPDSDALTEAFDAFTRRVTLSGTLSIPRPSVAKPVEARMIGTDSSTGAFYFPQAQELASELAESAPPKSTAPAPMEGSLSHTASRVKWVIGGVAIAAIALGVGALLLRGPPEPAADGVAATGSTMGPPAERASGGATAQPTTSATSALAVSSPAQELQVASQGSPDVAAKALGAILATSPDPFKDPAMRAAGAAAAARLADADHAEADAIFEKLGASEPGLDVLYAITDASETSKGASRARAFLDKPASMARASVGLRVAYDLKRASCDRRRFLFARAATDGDARSLSILSTMLPPACAPQTTPCCFDKQPELERAISEIRARIQP